MSVRVHTATASDMNLSVLSGDEVSNLYDLDEPIDEQALVIEDAGNLEAWVLIGSDEELLRFADDIRERVVRDDNGKVRGR